MNTAKRVFVVLLYAVLCIAAAAAQTDQNQTQQTQEGREARESRESSQVSETPEEVREEDLVIRDTETPQVELENGLTQFSVWDFLRMFLVLGGVIAAIYGVFFFLKKMGNPKLQGNTLISVLSTQNLQGNRALHLVEVGNEVFLIGSSEGGVELVGKIEDQETLDQVKLYRSELMAGGRSFQNSLKDMFFRSTPTKQGSYENEKEEGREAGSVGAALFMQKQRERLKNL